MHRYNYQINKAFYIELESQGCDSFSFVSDEVILCPSILQRSYCCFMQDWLVSTI